MNPLVRSVVKKGESEARVGFELIDLPHIDGDGDALRSGTSERAARDGAIVEVAPMGQLDVGEAYEAVVCGIDSEPSAIDEEFGPGVGGALTLHEAAGVAGGDTGETSQSYGDVGKILADALSELEGLRGRGIDGRNSWAIGHVGGDGIHETHGPCLGGLAWLAERHGDLGQLGGGGGQRRRVGIEKLGLAHVIGLDNLDKTSGLVGEEIVASAEETCRNDAAKGVDGSGDRAIR